MLTSIYYYNHYKPYILKSISGSNSASDVKEKKVYSSKNVGTNQSPFLNKALKKEIVNYANQLSENVNNIKESSKRVLQDIEEFNRYLKKRGFGIAKDWIKEDISNLVDSINQGNDFSGENTHSQTLSNFTADLKQEALISKKALEKWGVKVNLEGKLFLDEERFASLNKNGVKNAMVKTESFFSNVYNATTELLKKPLSDHMNFKGLGYYYNYKYGTIDTNTFQIIQSGLIVDRVI